MKNFKLLLASTAMLSTAFAMNVKADDIPSSTTLNATIGIVVKDTLTPGTINFGIITTDRQGGGEGPVLLKVNPDGTVDESSTAERIVEPSVVAMKMHGGYEGIYEEMQMYAAMDKDTFLAYTNQGGDATEEELAFAGAIFDIYQGYVTTGVSEEQVEALGEEGFGKVMYEKNLTMIDENNKTCGTVALTSPLYRITDELNGTMEVRVGGTFTLNSDYKPSSGINNCSASTTVTKIGNFL